MKELAVTDLDRDELLELIDRICFFAKITQRDLYFARSMVASKRVLLALDKASAMRPTVLECAHAVDRAHGNHRAWMKAMQRLDAARDKEKRLDRAIDRARAFSEQLYAHLDSLP